MWVLDWRPNIMVLPVWSIKCPRSSLTATASGESQSMAVRFLGPPSRLPMLQGSAKSSSVYSPLAAFGLPVGDLGTLVGWPFACGIGSGSNPSFL